MNPILVEAKMEGGSSLEKGTNGENKKGYKLGSVLQSNIEPFVPEKGHDPRELRSWAKRTGFVSTNIFGETGRSESSRREFNGTQHNADDGFGGRIDLDKGSLEKNDSISPKIEIDPILGRTRIRGIEIEPVSASGIDKANNRRLFRDGAARGDDTTQRNGAEEITFGTKNVGRRDGFNVNNENGSQYGNENNHGANAPVVEQKKENGDLGRDVNVYPDGDDSGDGGGWHPSAGIICGLRDNPGYFSIMFYSLQHYLSLAGSLIFIPLIVVPAMGGTDKDTATVISTTLLISGITTILHTYFGTRLPLVQGSSFVYLAPVLAIMNSREFRNLTEHRFLHTMREIQGAIIVGSIFQCMLGFSGLMSLFLRFIKPVVVAPTVAAVGLAFFSYGFPQAGACVEISLPEIFLILVFALYLRGVSVFGHKVFRIYAVPLSVVIIWAYAFFLTAGGAYNYKGCSPDIPSSNILIDACRKHAYTMKHCRTDVSDAMKTAAWVRIPYPLQWGIPMFRLRTSIIMIIVSLVTSIDSC